MNYNSSKGELRQVIIDGAITKYFLDINGNIYSMHGGKLKQLTPWIRNKYLSVSLAYTNTRNEKIIKTCVIHRLMLLTFYPIENAERYDAHHINHQRLDNRLCNLQWLLKSEHRKETAKYIRQTAAKRKKGS